MTIAKRRVTKAVLLTENMQLRALLAREIEDKAAIQGRLNEMLSTKQRTVCNDYMSFAQAQDYARHYGGIVRRVAETGRFTVLPKAVRA